MVPGQGQPHIPETVTSPGAASKPVHPANQRRGISIGTVIGYVEMVQRHSITLSRPMYPQAVL